MPGLIENIKSELETELQRQIDRLKQPCSSPFMDMLTYHMGWTGEGSGSKAIGKRIRPILLLLTTSACDAVWKKALPAAAAVES